jgi:hypothetical protein
MRSVCAIIRKTLMVSLTIFCGMTANAADEQGRFMRGGGTGSVPCTTFTSIIIKAQIAGGFRTAEGADIINSYVMYVLGFQTGYNLAAEGTYDIFANWGDNPSERALFWVNKWCQENPSKVFGQGVIEMAETLKKK